MQALSGVLEPEDFGRYARAGAAESAGAAREDSPAAPNMNIFASPPSKRFKLSHHELVFTQVPEPLRPRFLVSRQALDAQGSAHMHYGELETHELTIRNHDDKLLLVMADSIFDPSESILYYELETKSESFVATMGIERRYAGLELIGGAARDTVAIAQSEFTSQPYDPAIDIRTDTRYPLALKSRFLQDPLNGYTWAVRLQRLCGNHEPVTTAPPSSYAWHRIGVLLDRSNNSLSATRDGQIVATTSVGDEVQRLNSDIGLLPVFSLAKHGVARAVFGDPELENDGFKFDLKGYIEQRQREVAELVNKQVPKEVPVNLFSDYFQYYGYIKAAEACHCERPLRPSVPARAQIREAIMSGRTNVVPELLQSLLAATPGPALLAAIENQSAKEVALKHLLANTVPDAEEMKKLTTRDAAALLITTPQDRDAAVKRCKDERIELLDKVLEKVTQVSNESFSSPAFQNSTPVLRDLTHSFNTNIVGDKPKKNGTFSLLRGYLTQRYGSEFSGE